MQSASITPNYAVASKVKNLEESACFIVDLANGQPEDSERLWGVVDKLKYEAASLQGRTIHRSSVVPDST